MIGPVIWVLLVLLGLQVKHVLADYILQTPYMLERKGQYGHPGGLMHSGAHALLSGVVLWLATLSWGMILALILAEVAVHYHIDWSKERWVRRRNLTTEDRGYWVAIGIDQMLHHLTYLAMAALAVGARF